MDLNKKENIKVMIVDDSLTMRLFLKKILHEAAGIEVVATACDPIDAMSKLKNLDVDVMTLDVEMPKMDGITFLKKIMNLKPMPVVMVSTLTKNGSETAVEALNYGAVDVVGKPSHVAEEMRSSCDALINKVIEASYAKIGNKHKKLPQPKETPIHCVGKTLRVDDVFPVNKITGHYIGKPIIAIASSTGGPCVLKEILTHINDVHTPPIVIVQHIGAGFSEALAKSLAKHTALTVHHAHDGQMLQRGNVYLAESNSHMAIESYNNNYKIKLYDLQKVNRHKPSADVLFRSLNKVASKKCLPFILTGMGDDGAIGLKELSSSGAHTYVQSEESCTVYGMPRAALKLEPTHKSLNISEIIKKIKEFSS